MSHSADMLKQLQPFQRKSATFKTIFDAESTQFDNRDTAVADLNLQLSVDTATWALTIYENELGILVDSSKPNSDRRAVIKSKMRGAGKVNAVLIKLVADSYSHGDVTVTFDGSIRITFVSTRGVPPNLSDIEAAIQDIIPAHLGISFFFTYTTYDQIKAKYVSYDALVAANKTYGFILTEV